MGDLPQGGWVGLPFLFYFVTFIGNHFLFIPSFHKFCGSSGGVNRLIRVGRGLTSETSTARMSFYVKRTTWPSWIERSAARTIFRLFTASFI
jgi:hypothetical protein